MKFHKLTSRGISHIIVPLIFVVGFAVVGSYLIVKSKASTPTGACSGSVGTRRYGTTSHAIYNCQFWTTSRIYNVGTDAYTGHTFNAGTNWVMCQVQGSRIGSTSWNTWWAFTESNQGTWGWVNAYYARYGSNNERFSNVPVGCPSAFGRAPGQGTPAPAPTPTPAPRPGPSGYIKPFKTSGFTNQRIDEGVDFGGTGNVYAIGNGTVVHTFDSGWPGGVFIVYKLTNGAASGRYVYVAEGCSVKVSIGQGVNTNTILCYANGGGIETGWAQAPGNGWYAYSHVEYGQHGDGYATEAGQNFSALLRSLGAPYGNISQSSGRAPSASLAGFPNW